MMRYLMLFFGLYLAGAGGIAYLLVPGSLLAMELNGISIVCNLLFIFWRQR